LTSGRGFESCRGHHIVRRTTFSLEMNDFCCPAAYPAAYPIAAHQPARISKRACSGAVMEG
jgi:hypothetical protein